MFSILLTCAASLGGADLIPFRVSCEVDYDADGALDFVCANDRYSGGYREGGCIWIVSGADGELIHELTGDVRWQGLGVDFAEGVDIDKDDRADLVVSSVGTHDGLDGQAALNTLTAYSTRTWEELWSVRGKAEYEFGIHVALVGDVDKDGTGDFGVMSRDSIAIVSGATGKTVFSAQLPCSHTIGLPRFVADYDTDGILDLLVQEIEWTEDESKLEKNAPMTTRMKLLSSKRTLDPLAVLETDVLNRNRDGLIEQLGTGRDVDGDGFPEVVLGNGRENGSLHGRVRLWSPKTGKVVTSISGAPLANKVVYASPNSSFGQAVCLAGGQGPNARLIVGVPDYQRAATKGEIEHANSGRGVRGRFRSVSNAPGEPITQALVQPGAAFVFDALTGEEKTVLVGPRNGDSFGAFVHEVGDLDRDGIGDFVVTTGRRASHADMILGTGWARVYSSKSFTQLAELRFYGEWDPPVLTKN